MPNGTKTTPSLIGNCTNRAALRRGFFLITLTWLALSPTARAVDPPPDGGLSVETFGSGAEFLKSLDTRLPDCIVFDLHMPQMDGFSVQADLARKCAALPVIIITGHDLPKARERALEGGASAFLREPVHDHILLDAISSATAGGQTKTNNRKFFFANFVPQFPEKKGERWETPIQIAISPSESHKRPPEPTNVLDRQGNGRPRNQKIRKTN